MADNPSLSRPSTHRCESTRWSCRDPLGGPLPLIIETVPALLSDAEAAELRAARLTYPDVGATATGDLPQGFRSFTRNRLLAGVDLREAANELFTWRVHERAGLEVTASTPRVGTGTVVRMSLGMGRARVQIPCRVVYVVDEPRRVGFAYGTLPGHPESGEELFLLEQGDDGAVTFTITAFSRPRSLLARAGGPVTRRVQSAMTNRYLGAPDS